MKNRGRVEDAFLKRFEVGLGGKCLLSQALTRCLLAAISHPELKKNIQKVDLQNPDSFQLPSLYDFQDEIKFGQELFDYVIANYDNLKLKIEGRTPNWDSDRIAKIDYVILITAIAERP